jgi:hypothetical protein
MNSNQKALQSRFSETPKTKKICLNCLGNNHTKFQCKKKCVSRETLEANKKKVFGHNYKPPNSWQKLDSNRNGGNGSQGNQSKMAYVLKATKGTRQTQETTVFIDSGASHHYTGNVDRLTNYSENLSSHKLSGISSQLTTQGCGNLMIQTLYDGQLREVTFTQVYYVPGMQETLISISQLKQKGVTVDFKLLNPSCDN